MDRDRGYRQSQAIPATSTGVRALPVPVPEVSAAQINVKSVHKLLQCCRRACNMADSADEATAPGAAQPKLDPVFEYHKL